MSDYSYLAKEKQAIFDYISSEYGSPWKVFYLSKEQTEVPIEYIILAIKKEDKILLMTFGAGCYVTHNHEENTKERAEIFIELPYDWDFAKQENMWPVHFLINIIKYSFHHHLTLKWLQTFVNPTPFNNSDKIAGFLELPWYSENSIECNVLGNYIVSFYQILIISKDELHFQETYGIRKLSEYFADGRTRTVDLSRKSLV